MKAIFTIFRNDVRAIVKFFFVLVIVLAMGVLPSLYAWINMYATWDPYAETGNVPVALASRDSGIDLRNGSHVNSAREMIADLKDDPEIGYVPLDDPEEAVEGVRSGRFYAAVIFEDGFTYDMHHFEEAIGERKARITYYTNVKQNPVASKVTDLATSDLLEDINSRYVKSMLTEYFSDVDTDLDETDAREAVDTALEQLAGTRDAIADFRAAVTQIRSAGGDVTQSLKNAQDKLDQGRSKGRSDLSEAKRELRQAKKTIKKVSRTIDKETGKLKTAMEDLQKTLDQLQDPVDEETKKALTERAMEQTDRVLTILQNLRSILPENPRTRAGRIVADAMDLMISDTEHIKKLLTADPTLPEITTDADALKQVLEEDLVPSLKLMMSDIEKALKRSEPILKSARGVLDDIDPVLEGANTTVGSLGSTLGSLQVMLGSLETKLDDIITQVEEAEDSEKADRLAELLDFDAQQFTDFFTDFVEIEAEELFKPVTYGAAMTPFYTIIALWVGGVMMVTLMNCTVDRRKYPRITETQGFFGRYLIFFLIGQIQAAVVTAGDIFLLHCSPVHPWLMWLSASVTSMVFVALIYALTLVFGDVGRAAVVVIMVIQIAGSSGTYPIEILPPIFAKIYLFFPFPYAINAMREAICGLYGYSYIIYLAQLMVFFLCAAALGIFVRKPFLGVKQFMYDKMKETEVM